MELLNLTTSLFSFSKRLGDSPKPTKEQKDLSKMTAEEWNTNFAGHWNFAGARQNGYIAMFPEELPRRLIKMFSFVGETVLDPFVGSGTTALAAKNTDRNSIGFEINSQFISIIKEKLDIYQNDLNGIIYEFDLGIYITGCTLHFNLFLFIKKRIFTSIHKAV